MAWVKKHFSGKKYRFPSLISPLSSLWIFLASIAFVFALTPSIIPRDGILQGWVAGAALIIVYSLYVWIVGVWYWLGIRFPVWKIWRYVLYVFSLCIIIFWLWHVTDWQNSVHISAGLDPVESARPYTIFFISMIVFFIILIFGRLFLRSVLFIAHKGAKYIPFRISLFVSFLSIAYIFWAIGNGVFIQSFFWFVDRSSQQIDALMPVGIEAPQDSNKVGSSASLVAWKTLGSKGRDFILGVSSKEELAQYFSKNDIQDPIRVYVWLNSADTPEQRATLLLEEMKRVGAFSKKILVIVTPTGTGWIDPASIQALEYLLAGDVASVWVQYSYLPSWFTLLTEYDAGQESAKIMFETIYTYWKQLDPNNRPDLYIHGLSLGSRFSELSSDAWDLIGSPYQGALWVGPTFWNPLWKKFTQDRNTESSYFSPRYGDDTLVRFYTQYGTQADETRPWWPMRIMYFQNTSDAVTFFNPKSFWRAPEWMNETLPPDISEQFRYLPVVTFLQLFTDAMTATHTRPWHGHSYAIADYFQSWNTLIEPKISEDIYDNILLYFQNTYYEEN